MITKDQNVTAKNGYYISNKYVAVEMYEMEQNTATAGCFVELFMFAALLNASAKCNGHSASVFSHLREASAESKTRNKIFSLFKLIVLKLP